MLDEGITPVIQGQTNGATKQHKKATWQKGTDTSISSRQPAGQPEEQGLERIPELAERLSFLKFQFTSLLIHHVGRSHEVIQQNSHTDLQLAWQDSA